MDLLDSVLIFASAFSFALAIRAYFGSIPRYYVDPDAILAIKSFIIIVVSFTSLIFAADKIITPISSFFCIMGYLIGSNVYDFFRSMTFFRKGGDLVLLIAKYYLCAKTNAPNVPNGSANF